MLCRPFTKQMHGVEPTVFVSLILFTECDILQSSLNNWFINIYTNVKTDAALASWD